MKSSIFSHTSKSYAEFIQKKLGKGRRHALLVYQQWFRTGVVTAENPAFKNAQKLFEKIVAHTDFSFLPLAKKIDENATEKHLLLTKEGLEIEMVVLPMKAGVTLCISSQIGCRMGCAFCETGRMGLIRNLTVEEILSQMFQAIHGLKVAVRNIVFMGMGEPLDNFDAVSEAIDILIDPFGFGLGPRHITVSTSGLVDRMYAFIERVDPGVHLAVSVNAPNDEVRDRLMPVNRKHDMRKLREAMEKYCTLSQRKILAEYVLIKGKTDRLEDAQELAAYLQGLNVTINLIPYNPQSKHPFEPPTEEAVKAFHATLKAKGFRAFVRATKGQKIMAACGQLGNRELRKSKRGGMLKIFQSTELEDAMEGKKAAIKEKFGEEYPIHVVGRNLEITDAMKAYAVDKLMKIKRFGVRIIEATITMDIQRFVQTVDFIILVNDIKIKVSGHSNDMYSSVDFAIEHLEAKLRRYHKRLSAHHKQGIKDIEMNVNVLGPISSLDDINDQIEEKRLEELESQRPHPVTKKEKLPLKTLTHQEAIMKMELSSDAFMLFQSEEDHKLKVIYRREDGNYGIIEPQ